MNQRNWGGTKGTLDSLDLDPIRPSDPLGDAWTMKMLRD